MSAQILVLGMHRSGTSMLTRLLNLSGAFFGSEGDSTDIAGISEENPKGFWERKDVRSANEGLLAAAGCDWDCPVRWGQKEIPEAARVRFRKAASHVVLKLDANRPWAIKDPRLCLTAPYWIELLEQPIGLLCLRDPLEIAISLRRRNEFPLELGLALVEKYQLGQLHALGSIPFVRCLHADLLADPFDTMDRLLRELQGLGVEGLRLPRRPAIEAFVDGALYRSQVDEELRQRYADHPALALVRLMASPEAPKPASTRPTLSDGSLAALAHHERVLARLRERLASDERGLVHASSNANQRATARETRLTTRAQILRVRNRELRQRLGSAEAEVQLRLQSGLMLETRLELLEKRLSSTETGFTNRLAEVSEQAQSAHARIQQLGAEAKERAARDREASVLKAKVDAQRQAELVKMRAALAESRERVDRASRQLSDIRRLFDAHVSSARWRVGSRVIRAVEVVLGRSKPRLASDDIQLGLDRLSRALASTSIKPASNTAADPAAATPPSAPTPKTGSTAPIPVGAPSGSSPSAVEVGPLFGSGTERVTVVIPVFNAVADTRRCIESVLRHTAGNFGVLVIDDASTDPQVGELLKEYAGHPRIQLLRNESNLGFVATVNIGFVSTLGDVVILNSDAEVTAGWLARLCWTAYSRPWVATVTPLSNAAGPFSIPMKDDAAADDAASDTAMIVRRVEDADPLEVPTGHGFCLYIRRASLTAIGGFDDKRFPRGYGEENDFCMRALKAGWVNLVDARTFVFHKSSASFGGDKEELLARNRRTLDELHPDYKQRITAGFGSDAFRAIGDRIDSALRRAPVRPRVLFVIHAGGGGTVNTNADLMKTLDGYDCFMLEADKFRLVLSVLDRSSGALREVATYTLDRPWEFSEQRRADFAAIYQRVLIENAIDLVHVRHLIAHTDDLVDALAALQLPLVFSFHDFYMLCPTIQLLDSANRYCGGKCRVQRGQCQYSKSWLGPDVPNLSKDNDRWRQRSAAIVEASAHLITTTSSARSVIQQSLPATRERPFIVIEHGRDFPDARPLRIRPEAGAALRVLVPGQLGNCKGIDLLRQIKALDTNGDIEFHFLGKGSERLADIGVSHGEYQRAEFPARVAEIAPSVAAVLSIWPETYCHTLSEAWAYGLPVIATRIGALEERIEATGGGWLIDLDRPSQFIELAASMRRHAAFYDEAADRVDRIRLPSVEHMAQQYDGVYRSVMRVT